MGVARESACTVCAAPIVPNGSKRSPRRYCSLACRQEGLRKNLRTSYQRHRGRRLEGSRAWQEAHPVEVSAARTKWTANRTDEQRRHAWANRLRRKYSMTPADYDRMLAEQGGVCWICREPERRRDRAGRPMLLVVDHDHVTGRVRGLLCARCNSVLGWIESPGKLDAALAYLALAEGQEESEALA